MPSASASLQSPPQTPRIQAGCPHDSQIPSGKTNIRCRRWRQDRCRCRTRRRHRHSRLRHTDAVGIGVRLQSPPQTPRASSFCRHSRSLLRDVRIHTRRCARMLRSCTRRVLQHMSSSSSQMPSASTSAAQSPPQTPRASSLVSVTVAVSFGDVRTTALVDGTRSVADTALVVGANTVVYVVTDAIGIGVRLQSPPHTPGRQAGCRHSRSLLRG